MHWYDGFSEFWTAFVMTSEIPKISELGSTSSGVMKGGGHLRIGSPIFRFLTSALTNGPQIEALRQLHRVQHSIAPHLKNALYFSNVPW